MNIELNILLGALKKCILSGEFTKAQCVDEQTFICIKYIDASGLRYAQYQFEQLPKEWQTSLQYKKVGETVAHVKIIAIFDIWAEETIANPIYMPKAS